MESPKGIPSFQHALGSTVLHTVAEKPVVQAVNLASDHWNSMCQCWIV